MSTGRLHNPMLGLVALLLGLMLMVVVMGAAGSFLITSFQDKWLAVNLMLVLNSLCFALPALAFRKLIIGNNGSRKTQRMNIWICAGLCLIAWMAQPVAEWAAFVNEQMSSWPMLSSLFGERDTISADLLQEAIKFDSLLGWTVTILTVALIPAICEEMYFRLTLLPAIKRVTHSWHSAIIISALVFSAMHLDSYGFLPRFLLGGVMGVAFYLTRSVWSSIIIHATNNIIVVVSLSTCGEPVAKALVEPADNPGMWMPIASTVAVVAELYVIDRLANRKTTNRQEPTPA